MIDRRMEEWLIFTTFEQAPQEWQGHLELKIITNEYSKLDLNEYSGNNRLFLS